MTGAADLIRLLGTLRPAHARGPPRHLRAGGDLGRCSAPSARASRSRSRGCRATRSSAASPSATSTSSAARRSSPSSSSSTTARPVPSGFFESIGLWWLLPRRLLLRVLTFTLNTAAYQAEILRGAIQSVPRGQREAAMALGLHGCRRALPGDPAAGADRRAPPARQRGDPDDQGLGGRLASSRSSTSWARRDLAFARSFDLSIYLWAAVLYLILVESLSRVWNLLERRLTTPPRASPAQER